jgi:hypothetical protein
MADRNQQPSAAEMTLMLSRSGLTIPSEQLEHLCAVVGRLEAAAHRLRQDLVRNDEPASMFLVGDGIRD